jgi:hypothetical protein
VIEVHHSNFTIFVREAGPVQPSRPIAEYVPRWPQLARVDFGGSSGIRTNSGDSIEEVSPKTSVSISLEVQRPTARSMLPPGS